MRVISLLPLGCVFALFACDRAEPTRAATAEAPAAPAPALDATRAPIDEPVVESIHVSESAEVLAAIAAEALSGEIQVTSDPGGGVRIVKDTRALARVGIEAGAVVVSIDRAPVTKEQLPGLFADARDRGALRVRLRGNQGFIAREVVVAAKDDGPASPCADQREGDCSVMVDRQTFAAAVTELGQAAITPREDGLPRVLPSVKNGKPVGMKLFAVRSTNAVSRIGVMNGDTLITVQRHAVRDGTALAKALVGLATAGELVITIERTGKPLTLIVTAEP